MNIPENNSYIKIYLTTGSQTQSTKSLIFYFTVFLSPVRLASSLFLTGGNNKYPHPLKIAAKNRITKYQKWDNQRKIKIVIMFPKI